MSVESGKRPKTLPQPLYGASLPALPDGTIMVGDESNCLPLGCVRREADKSQKGQKPKKD